MWNWENWKRRMFSEMTTSECHVLHGLDKGPTQPFVSCSVSQRICCMTLSLVCLFPTDCALPSWSRYLYSTPPPSSSLTNLSWYSTPLVFNPSVLSIHLPVCFCLCRLCLFLYVQMYPALQISHVEESLRPVTIPSWCKKGLGHCQTHPFIVLPYRCLGKSEHYSLPLGY